MYFGFRVFCEKASFIATTSIKKHPRAKLRVFLDSTENFPSNMYIQEFFYAIFYGF